MTAALVKRRIDAALSALVDGAPDALDTLNKLAAALGDDASFATSLTQTLAAKADSAHHHDGRYYTEAEADRRFARQVNAGRAHPGIVQLDDIATLRAAMDATPAAYDRAVSTRALALLVASESRRGLAERASTAEADAGDDTERFMTAALVKRRIDAAIAALMRGDVPGAPRPAGDDTTHLASTAFVARALRETGTMQAIFDTPTALSDIPLDIHISEDLGRVRWVEAFTTQPGPQGTVEPQPHYRYPVARLVAPRPPARRPCISRAITHG